MDAPDVPIVLTCTLHHTLVARAGSGRFISTKPHSNRRPCPASARTLPLACTMARLGTALLICVLAVSCSCAAARVEKDVTTLNIGVKHRPKECNQKSKPGDKLSMHYSGYLTTGDKFDSSRDRNQPFDFTLGSGQVIKGWEQGLTNMCIGEKRKLKIPPHLGYGHSGAGAKIPGGATLIFDVELLAIN